MTCFVNILYRFSIKEIKAIILFLMISFLSFAQSNQGNIWYFGSKAGLDFNSGVFPPAILADSKINTSEGCASISDENGQLLFYTDGTNVWDRTHIPMPNANGSYIEVFAIAVQSDGKIIIGGNFLSYDGFPRDRIARLNTDGSLDLTFDPGTGFNDKVTNIALQPDGKIVVTGNFTLYNGTSRSRIARLNTDGSLDLTFDPGTGTNFLIFSFALQPDGKIVIGGNFTLYNGTSINRIARINADGSFDGTFGPGTGVNGTITTLSLQVDGKIIIGGAFTSYNGTGRNRIARVNTNGTLDGIFDPGTGTDDSIKSLAIQSDGKVVIGGSFTQYNGTGRNRIARVNTDGSLDATYNPGTGVNLSVNTLILQPDDKAIIGGVFTQYNGTGRNRIARVNTDGTLDGIFDPGTGINGIVYSLYMLPDTRVIIGGIFNAFNNIGRGGLAMISSSGVIDNTAFKDYWNFILSGDISSSQSAIITPVQGPSGRYYIFTTDGSSCNTMIGPKGSWDGLYYTIIDMSLNSGMGDIDTAYIRSLGYSGNKIPLADSIAEKITAVAHPNRFDYWIITQKHFTGDFYAFKVNCSGVDSTPVISLTTNFGFSGVVPGALGWLTASLDGKSLASAYYANNANNTWLSDFNDTTGYVTGIQRFGTGDINYGICFSPNDSILYVHGSGRLRRYNRYTLVELPVLNPGGISGALQLGPDGRIYMSRSFMPFLSVLHDPNNFSNPNMDIDAISLSPGTLTLLGLPPFFNYYAILGKYLNGHISRDTICYGDTLQTNYSKYSGFTYQWSPTIGVDSPDIANPIIYPDTTTTYLIRISNSCDTIYDTLQVAVFPTIEITPGNDTAICLGDSLILSVEDTTLAPYVWSTGDTGFQIIIADVGTYVVQLIGNICTNEDTLNVSSIPFAEAQTFLEDTTVCIGVPIPLIASGEGTFIWLTPNGEELSTEDQVILYPEENMSYILLLASNECSTDTMFVYMDPILCDYMIPNSFSPDGDGWNDTWQIIGEEIKSVYITVYDRFGKLIFKSENINMSWDGYSNNIPLPSDVYVYYVQLELLSNIRYHVIGNVTLIR